MNSRMTSFTRIALTVVFVATGSWVARAADAPAATEIKLEALKWQQFLDRIASNKQAKFTVVDAWATTCGPCKENFPHLVEMDRKYRDKGLAVISLSLDDNSDKKALVEAEKFLRDKKAKFTNILLDEEFGVGFEKLNIGAIPAVFLYGPDGKEIARFTMDDTRNQFTYEDVEKAIIAVLDGKPLPKTGK